MNLRKIAILLFGLIIPSCISESDFSTCEQKFIGSYFSLHMLQIPFYSKTENKEINIPDSSRLYMRCMMKLKPRHFVNYYWKSKMHILLAEYDSVIYTMEGLNFKLDDIEKYQADIFTGFGYELMGEENQANMKYREANEVRRNSNPQAPIYEALDKYLLGDNPVQFKSDLEQMIEDANKQEPNEMLKTMYKNRIEKLPFSEGRKEMIIYIATEYNNWII